MQVEGFLATDFSSPVVLVTGDEADASQFIVVERNGTAWFPRYTAATCFWSKAYMTSPVPVSLNRAQSMLFTNFYVNSCWTALTEP